MFQNLFDSHTHSDNSPDAMHAVAYMAEQAVEKGVHGLAVTDHFECDSLEEYGYGARILHSAFNVAMAKEAFRHTLILTTGIELGQPGYDMAGAEQILTTPGLDFVLLSLHRVRGHGVFYRMDYSEMSADTIHGMLLCYFDELLELIRWGKFDVLAHMTFPYRYLHLAGAPFDPARYVDAVDAVLQALVADGKGLEVNTSALLDNLYDTMPPAWAIRRFRELGGQHITIGSDAHAAWDIGRGIPDAMQLLQDAGWEYFTFYRGRQPISLKII